LAILNNPVRWRRIVSENIMKEVGLDRRSACLWQAELCRNRAKTDSIFRAVWLAEATKWQRRADEECVKNCVEVKSVIANCRKL